MKIILFLISLLSLTSCIELLDDITINSDGSGTFKYSINLSSSKSKVNSIIALDSIDGRKVPGISEIQQKILDFKTNLSKQPGIKNVVVEYNFTDYIFKMNCEFDNVKNLQIGLQKAFEITSGQVTSNQNDWLIWSNNKLERNIPTITVERFKSSKWLDTQLLSSGTYTSISRFDKEIESFTNIISKVSKTKKAIMTQVKTDELFNNTQLLKNKILLEGSK
jgi:hypothetical protein